MTDDERVQEMLAALLAEHGEPDAWDEKYAMSFARFAYGQGYLDALKGAEASA